MKLYTLGVTKPWFAEETYALQVSMRSRVLLVTEVASGGDYIEHNLLKKQMPY